MSWIYRLLAAACFICSCTSADAADIKISDDPQYNIILEGTIVKGDYDKLRNLIEEICPENSWSTLCSSDIYLASPGGSVIEAIKIGRLIRRLRLEVQIPGDASPDLRQKIVAALNLQNPQTNYLCASACFFVAVGGIERKAAIGNAILGIHRPSMTDADLKNLGADQVIASTAQLRGIVEMYLKEMGVPARYADLMFSIPKDQTRWITKAEYRVDFDGVIPELRERLSARCDNRTEVEKRLEDLFEAKVAYGEKLNAEEQAMRSTLATKSMSRVQCESASKEKMREDAWKAYRRP